MGSSKGRFRRVEHNVSRRALRNAATLEMFYSRQWDRRVLSFAMYILVVEDDPFLSYDLREALLALHPDVREADSVGAAMLILARGLPYLAVLDYDLKAETTAALAARLARENVPFCYVTADGDRVREDPEIPECPILSKPYRVGDVTALAAGLLNG